MKSKLLAWTLIVVGVLMMLAALAIPKDSTALVALIAGLAVLLMGVVMNERLYGAALAWPE